MPNISQPFSGQTVPICDDAVQVNLSNDLPVALAVQISDITGATIVFDSSASFPPGSQSSMMHVAGSGFKWFSAFGGSFSTGYSFSASNAECCSFHPVPLPVAFLLEVMGVKPHKGVKPGKSSDSEAVNRPALLIHSRGRHQTCWHFSRAIYGGEEGNPAYWMLRKTSKTTWRLTLRRVSHEVVEYHCTTKKSAALPEKFEIIRPDKGGEFKNWPRFIKVSPA